jgi:AraC-like DNA-binding protein
MPADCGCDAADFSELSKRWLADWPGGLGVVDLEGRPVHGEVPLPPATAAHAVAEALRFGEPAVVGSGGHFCWAVPLTYNARLTGGIVAWIDEPRLFPHGIERPACDMRKACTALRELVEAANLTNAALLSSRRDHHERERQRAAFLHALKRGGLHGLTATYMREESALVAAIRAGDRGQARAIVNRMLTGIYHQAAGSVESAKALLLELVVLMLRTAVEAGGRRNILLGGQVDLLGLGPVRDDEELARWLRRSLETIFDSLERNRRDPDEDLYQRALRFINEHCEEDLGRDTVAEAAGVSPQRLTRLVQTYAGRGFNDLINRARIDRAKELLDQGRSALDVALEVGFADASYFTKIFRKQTGMTPSDYRKRSG